MKLKKQFKDFYNEIRITSESEALKEKREILQKDIEDKFPDELKKHNIELNKSDIEVFDQGSYHLHTTIKNNVIDRDVAVMIPLNIEDNPDPRKIKVYLSDALSYVSARTVSIKEPCINVAYYEDGEEWMHIDLPLYAKYNDKIYLARGRTTGTNYSWEPADPRGLNDDLFNKISGNDQLRRIIRYIKKWKNEKYKNSTLDHEVPPSIGLTYLACDCFVEATTSEGDDDLISLQQTMSAIENKFLKTYENDELVKVEISRYLTVEPYSDIFEKMRCSDDYCMTFYNRFSTALQNLTDACNAASEHDAGKCVKKVFGDEFIVPPKETNTSYVRSKKEHGFG